METLGSFRDTARPSAWGSFPLGEIPGMRRAAAARAQCWQRYALAQTDWIFELQQPFATPQKPSHDASACR